MTGTAIQDVLRKIKSRVQDDALIQLVEQASACEVLAELDREYPVRFQERRLGTKWEVGLAHSLRYEIASFSSRSSFFPMHFLVPVLRRCLFLSGEADKITGLAIAARVLVRPTWKPVRGLALTTSRGCKLDKDMEGWNIKTLEKRTVKLSQDFLKKRGWRFDVLARFPLAAGTGPQRIDSE